MDGAFTPERVGIGIIVRNNQGEVEAVMVENIQVACDAEHVELLAMLKALQFAKDFGISHCIIEGDALAVVQKVKSKQEASSMMGHIVDGIRGMIKEFPAVQVTRVNRKNNDPAHEAAKLGPDIKDCYVWFTYFPKSVLYAAKTDLIG